MEELRKLSQRHYDPKKPLGFEIPDKIQISEEKKSLVTKAKELFESANNTGGWKGIHILLDALNVYAQLSPHYDKERATELINKSKSLANTLEQLNLAPRLGWVIIRKFIETQTK